MLSEIRQRKTNIVWSHLYVKFKDSKLIETENRMVVDAGGRGGENGQREWKGINF